MPRPIAAGVLGIARTSAARGGNACSRKRSVGPAMIESTTVEAPTNGASPGITAGAVCGLTASTMADTSPTASAEGLRRRPPAASAVSSLPGCGSSTAIFFGSRPSASQPSSRALPILPAPTSRRVPEKSASGCGPGVADVLMALSVTDERDELTPALASRTWRRRAPRAPACRPRPRTGTPGSNARRRRARSRAAPRIAGSRPRHRRRGSARGGT